jgi:hypothetical protein
VNKILIKAVLPLGVLGACAGRSPQPVAVVQPQDRYADCAAIIAEGPANNTKIQELAGDEGSKVAQNVAAGVVGIFIWPVLFGMDFQGAAGKEVAALQSRQQYLAVLAEQRNCGVPTSVPVPRQAPIPIASTPLTTMPISTPTAPPAPISGSVSPLPLVSVSPADHLAPNNSTSSLAPAVPRAASDMNSYEQAMQQYRQAEQQYQHQLELQHAQQWR